MRLFIRWSRWLTVLFLLLWGSSSSARAATDRNNGDRPPRESTNGGGDTSSNNNNAAPSPFLVPPPGPGTGTGPIDDAKCNIEDLEEANDSQLHSILHDLKATSFFRSFAVNLDAKCPLRQWRQKQKGGEGEADNDNGESDADAKAEKEEEKLLAAQSARQEEEEDEDEDEEDIVECTGGKDELDVEAPPLCTVDTSGDNQFGLDGGGGGGSNGYPFSQQALDSNALASYAQEGFRDKSQQNTFAWRRHKDLVVQDDDRANAALALEKDRDGGGSNGNSNDASCGEEALLPDDFWVDMCSGASGSGHDEGAHSVNLALNPERNTGYNGTHIWRAIYDENCVHVQHGEAKYHHDSSEDMCFEERVLYRLLSGLHASTTLSIAIQYYPPSKRKGRPDWEASPQYFMDRFQDHPEYIRNLHFSYVVLLRALSKAAPFLSRYEIRTGNIVEDETAAVLLHRLLDSRILGSCSSVFGAFDESLMFQESSPETVVSLQQNFKGVFHNVSSILDCVQCQQCKLHGKLTMLGYGAALKVLFMQSPVLERNEIVALVNTIAKFSESIRHVRELTHMYWEVHRGPPPLSASKQQPEPVPTVPAPSLSSIDYTAAAVLSLDAVDKAVQVAAALGRDGLVSPEREEQLVRLALAKQPELLILARHYGHDTNKFLRLSSQFIGTMGASVLSSSTAVGLSASDDIPDAVIVGSGLAGLAAALNILDRGGKVIMIEKEHLIGGNSNKASSGINGCCLKEDNATDTLELFREDTLRSAGTSAKPHLIDALVTKSAGAVTWLKTRAGVDLSLLAQLGGHSAKRTHRPNNGMAGAEIIYGMQKAVRAYEKTGKLKLLLDTRVTGILTDDKDERVTGVKYVSSRASAEGQDGGSDNETPTELRAENVILATGGFAADRSVGSFLEKYRPELLKLPTTAGAFSTGDGISLATSLGAGTVDMDKVQLHPTGWVDPTDPDNKSKFLAAELMRGVGGILLNEKGQRFCNELGTRAYVTDKMLAHNANYAQTGKWNPTAKPPSFYLVLSSSAAEDGRKHVDLYTHKGFLTKVQGVAELAKITGHWKSTLVSSLKTYQESATNGEDEVGKTQFRGVPQSDLDSEVFYVGKVTPVLHYCMGGITIDAEGNVLREDGSVIPGLHAAGEVTGGVHGVNRLGGNSLLECTVYGTIVGQKIAVKDSVESSSTPTMTTEARKGSATRIVPFSELQEHNTPEDCWVAIHDIVYDLTLFAEEHPAGPTSIHVLAGMNGTDAFAAVHNERIMEDFDEDRIGILSAEEASASGA